MYNGALVEVIFYGSAVTSIKVNGIKKDVRTDLLSCVQFADTPNWRDPRPWNHRTGH